MNEEKIVLSESLQLINFPLFEHLNLISWKNEFSFNDWNKKVELWLLFKSIKIPGAN